MHLIDMFKANQIRDGDVKTFEKLIDEYKRQVFTYCLNISNSYPAAEELAQDVFLKVYMKIDSYDGTKSSLSTWIYTITHNSCLNYMRDRRNQVLLPIDESYADRSPSPQDQYIQREENVRLTNALTSLPDEDREIVLMKDYLGMKYREISQVTGIPTGTIKSRLHGIRLNLRQILGDNDE